MGEFSPPPLFLSFLLSFFFSYPSNIEIIFDFFDITKIHPPFQNPGSALALFREVGSMEPEISMKMLTSLSEKLGKISCHHT